MCEHKTAKDIIKTCTSACRHFATCENRKASLEEALLDDALQVSSPANRFMEALKAPKLALVHSV
jgi:hypothetical protein